MSTAAAEPVATALTKGPTMYRRIAIASAVLAIAAPAASADARPVSLDDARYAPHDLTYLQPGACQAR